LDLPLRSSHVDVLPFELAGHRFGLLVADVQEVLRAVTISPLPRAPSAVLGVINVRGSLVPVYDVRGRFGLPARALRLADSLIVVQNAGRPAAIVAEWVQALTSLPSERIDACQLQTGEAQHVRGVARLDDGNIIIYDLRAFLTHAEQTELELALGEAEA
jgi:purine-binding chemotaxis protein CheW